MKKYLVALCFVVGLGIFLGAVDVRTEEMDPVDEPVDTIPLQEDTKSEAEYDRGLSPGLVVSAYQPFESGKTYLGAGLHYVFFQGLSEAEDLRSFGGFAEWYAEIMYFKELDAEFNTDIFFTYALGLTLSFEKLYGGARSYLLPTFGVQAGGIYFNTPPGNGLLLVPNLGLVLVAGPSFSLALDARFYLNTFELGDFIGPGLTLTTSFNL